MKITLLLVFGNESKSKYLSEFLKWNLPIFDHFIAFDDASNDGTSEILKEFGFMVKKSDFSRFKNELLIRQNLVDAARIEYPDTDWFFILDSDELILASREELEFLIHKADSRKCTGISFQLVNLWKDPQHYRIDELFNKVRKVHAWKNFGPLHFKREAGLHNQLHPQNLRRILNQEYLRILHLGFSSTDLIIKKFIDYKMLGQRGRNLWRLLDERNLQVEHITSLENQLGKRFENWMQGQEDSLTEKTILSEYLWRARRLEKESEFSIKKKPLVSIVCLIYQGLDWLEFAYGELLELQSELQDGVAEILFCANDPSAEVVNFLKSNLIPHTIFRNEDPEEHYISRVYRAYNHAVEQSLGEYCLLVNSDMAYAPGFLTQMLSLRSPDTLLVGQLIESGVLKPAPMAIKKNFGKNLKNFKRDKFIKFVSKNRNYGLKSGGLFMPLLVHRNNFIELGKFPEGNLVPNSLPDYLKGNKPVISKPKEPCVSGDSAFFQKAETLGMKHLTNSEAITYHFQEGEKRDSRQKYKTKIRSGIAIANDSLFGINNERVLWNILIDLMQEAGAKVLEWNTGKIQFPIKHLKAFGKLKFVQNGQPRILLQNASYIPKLKGAIRNISLLQDNIKDKRLLSLQNKVLRNSQVIVTNSISMINLDSSAHNVWQPLPINDIWTETPLSNINKVPLRTIFVGALDETKGWKEVKSIINNNPNIEFIIVSKYGEDLESLTISKLENVQIYNQISQEKLISLVDTCELFILGSKFETQCLAAMEAASRNLAIIMKPTGLLGESPDADEFGYFSDNLASAFDNAVKDYSNNNKKNPRKAFERMHFSTKEIEKEWEKIFLTEMKQSFRPQIKSSSNLTHRMKNKIFGPKLVKLND